MKAAMNHRIVIKTSPQGPSEERYVVARSLEEAIREVGHGYGLNLSGTLQCVVSAEVLGFVGITKGLETSL